MVAGLENWKGRGIATKELRSFEAQEQLKQL